MVVSHEDTQAKKTTIKVIGGFRSDLRNDFLNAYKNSESQRFIVDFAETNSLSRSALGLVLMMSDHLAEQNKEMQLINVDERMAELFSWTTIGKTIQIN